MLYFVWFLQGSVVKWKLVNISNHDFKENTKQVNLYRWHKYE